MSTIRRSAIWNVFTETHKSDFIATCNLCSQEFCYRSTTTNLMKHLQRKHPGVDVNSPIQQQKVETLPKEVEIVIERQLENTCEVKSFKVEVQPVTEDCNYIVLNTAKPIPRLWDYFTKLSSSDCVASCIVCHKEFSYKTTTWNLKKHLDRNHPELQAVSDETNSNFIAYNSDEDTSSSAENSSNDLVTNSRKNSSPMWKFFTKVSASDSIAMCNFCRKNISYKSTISNLQKHIDRKHPRHSIRSFNSEEENLESSSSGKTRSLMWKYFTKIPLSDYIASCNFCQKEISYKSTIGNLQKHMNRKHFQELSESDETSSDSDDDDIVESNNGDTAIQLPLGKRESRMWEFFTKIENSNTKASCNFCKKKISYRSSTGNLQKHLNRKHTNQSDVSDDENKCEWNENTEEIVFHCNEKQDSDAVATSVKKGSRMWEFFTKVPDSETIATCNFCKKDISYKSTTNNLQKHILRKHPKKMVVGHERTKKFILNNPTEELSHNDEKYSSDIVSNSEKSEYKVWEFFTKMPASDSTASCNICKKEFSYKTTTGNLKKHVYRKHKQLVDLSDEQEHVYQESNEEFDQNKNAALEQKEVEGQYQHQSEQILLDGTKVFQNIDSNTNDPNQQVNNNTDDLDNDFWNLDQSDDDDDDPDFRPSPTFDEVVDTKNKSITKKRSQIWNVFTEKPNSDCVAICNVCNQEFCYRSTTNNLKKHFQRKHPDASFDIKIERVKEENILPKQTDSTSRIHKTDGDDDDRDSSDGNTKRKRSQIWKYFTRKKPGEYIAICNICKKELGFRSTTSNLKKHLDRKHPNVKMKSENDDEEKKSAPEVRVKTCLVCLQSDQTEPREFLQINNTNSEEEKSYMTKIQEIMNQSVVIDETHVICLPCVDDLEKVIQFKEKVSKAFEFWSKVEPEPDLETYDNDADDVNNSDYSDLEDGESLAKFTCSKCNKVFPSPSVMLKHNCGQSRKEKSSLRKDTSQETFYCEFCGKSFNIRWKLNKHLKICQSNSSKQFGCNLCNRIFKKAYHLREHMASHTGERNYSCNLCGKTFQRSSSKHKHMRSHNAKPGEKSKKTPFLCTICGKSFPYSNGASRHMRVHLGERRHQCHICLKKFSQTTHLKVHLRTHSGERPYCCMICGRTFSLNASLRKHMRLHVGSGDFVKLVKNLETGFPSTDMVTEDGLQILTAVPHEPQEIDMDGNQCIG